MSERFVFMGSTQQRRPAPHIGGYPKRAPQGFRVSALPFLGVRAWHGPRDRRTLGAGDERIEMAGVQALDFDSPDETRTPDKTRVDVVRIGDTAAGRFAFEPGWKWSECVKPV